MRRLIVIVGAAAAALVGSLAASAAETGVRLAPIDGPTFPERAFVLQLPKGQAVAQPVVRVTENGDRVKDLGVVPATASRRGNLGMLLVIDASDSMRGDAIEAAVVASRTLAARRGPRQRVGIVTFNRTPRVILQPTTDSAQIDAALASTPRLDQGTRFYDALAAALDLAERQAMRSPSIVLLSDGADTGSGASASDVMSRAHARGVRIFTVGLESNAFVAAPLEELAAGTGATYAQAASAAELGPVFDALGYQLANEYVVEYLSLAGPQQKVRVNVEVEGVGVGRSTYVTPALAIAAAPAFDESASDTVWTSPLTMLLTVLVVAALLAVSCIVLVRPRNRRLRTLMAEFVTIDSGNGQTKERTAIPTQVFAGAERSLSRSRLWASFKEELEIAQIKMPAVQILLWTVVGTVTAFLVLRGLTGMPVALLAFGFPVLVRMYLRRKLQRRRNAFSEQLPDNLQVLGSALRAGHSLVGALSVVVGDAPEPSRAEFQRVVADEQLGIPLDQSLLEVARRMDCKDLEQVALVAAVSRQTGGNSAEVLDQVTKVVRERFELRRLVKALTAQGRLSNWVLASLPPALVILISIINPGYLDPLLDTQGGRAFLVLAAAMTLTGSLIIKKIVNIRV